MGNLKYNTIIFDLDGTLLNTLTDLTNSLNYALMKFDIELATEEKVMKNLGNGYYRLIDPFLPNDKKNLLNSVYEYFSNHYKKHCNDYTKPYDGIIELLNELNKYEIKLGIVSNKNDDAVKELVKLHFNGLIKCAYGVSEKVRKKPDKDLVVACLKELSSNEKETIYVGDSEVDLLTAKNSMIECISVSWGFRSKTHLIKAGATTIIDKPNELLQYLLE